MTLQCVDSVYIWNGIETYQPKIHNKSKQYKILNAQERNRNLIKQYGDFVEEKWVTFTKEEK